MATYLEGGVDFIPPVLPFQPNYNLILSTLQYRQGQYDQGFAQLKSSANSVINSQLLNETNIEKRKQILANAESALKSLPTVDLSLPQNVTAAKSVFRPFYEDTDILIDMKETKSYTSERNRGMALRNSDKEEERKRYWNIGIQDLDDWAEEFSKASPEQMRMLRSRRYVGKPQTGENIMEMFNTGKLNRTVDKITGQVKITDTNGKELAVPLTNLFLSRVQADPEEMEAYNVYGRVTRNRYIRDNESRFGSREAAATEHDRILLKDYKTYNTELQTTNNEALRLVEDRLTEWKKRDVTTLTPQERDDFASDINSQAELKGRATYFQKALDTASDNIIGNPAGYLGQTYMHKSAKDLANALSAFGKREINSNPLYKDFEFPFIQKRFETDENIRQKEAEAVIARETKRLEMDLEAEYGKRTTDKDGKQTGGASRNQLNIPIVSDNRAGSAVPEYKDGIPDSYGQYQKNKSEIVNRVTTSKLDFVDYVLSAEEFRNEKGEVMDQNEKQTLRSNGKLLDKLVQLGISKVKNMDISKDPNRSYAMMLQEKVDSNMNLWRAMDTWREGIMTNISKNLEGSRKEDGWVFKHMLNNGMLRNNAGDFITALKNDSEFKNELTRRMVKEAAKPSKVDLVSEATPGGLVMRQVLSPYTQDEIQNNLVKEYADKFKDYQNEVIRMFNTSNKGGGYNFITQFDPKAANGGGGVNARKLMFVGSSSVSGEEADNIALDLLPKLEGGEGTEDVAYMAGADIPARKIGNQDGVKKAFQEVIKPHMLIAAKAGDDSPIKSFTVESSMVGANNANYHVYTFKFDPDYIKKLQGSDTQPGLVGDAVTAKSLTEGVSIYIKSDKDRSSIAQRSSIGEIEMLVNSNKTGVLEKSITPDYNFRIEKMIQGGYKIITNYKMYTEKFPDGKMEQRVITVPENGDLSYMYYTTISKLHELYFDASKFRETIIANSPTRKIFTMQDILDRAAQMREQ